MAEQAAGRARRDGGDADTAAAGTITLGTVRVPGAELYYEVRGEGPVLLLIPGGMGDCGVFRPLAGLLADRYTVVGYDRRGQSRSLLTGPVQDLRMAEQSDDARLLLDEVGADTAYVLGSSNGAIIALDLMVRYPDRVAGLVAHEPPLFTLLPDGDEQLAFFDGLAEVRRERGLEAAMGLFAARMIPDADPPRFEPGFAWDPEFPERQRGNAGFWFDREARQSVVYRPDLAALRAVADRLVPGVGEISGERHPARAAVALAAAVGAEVARFPGGHVGYVTRPRDFSEELAAVLADVAAAG